MRILTVEEDAIVAECLREIFTNDGHEVQHLRSGEEALARLKGPAPDFVILGVGLPGIRGLDVVTQFRERGVWTPVLMLSADDSKESIVECLKAGADDYLVKPFAVAELKVRMEAICRRTNCQPPTNLRTLGALNLDLLSRSVTSGKGVINLTPMEFSLLWALAEEVHRVWSREDLLRRVWGNDFDQKNGALEVHLHHLRKKLATIGSITIENLRGKGYRLKVREKVIGKIPGPGNQRAGLNPGRVLDLSAT